MKQRRGKGGRFTNIENEREQQRKLYEENLRKKKEMLYFEFEKQEEVLKYSKISVESHNDVNFKYEHDRVTNYRIEKENQLNNLMKILKDAEEINQLQEPLPEGQSLFGQPNKGTNLTSIFSKSYYRSSGLQIMSSSQQRSREDVNNYLAYLQEQIEQVNENLKNEDQRTHTLQKSMQELFKTKQKYRDQLHDLEFLNETADRRFHDLAAVQFKSKEKKIAIDKDLNAAKKSLKEYQQIGEKYKEKQLIKMKHGEKIKKTAEEIISHDMIRQDELERENQQLMKQIQNEIMKQQSIIQKRSESKYILKYIDTFTTFERLFLNGPIKEKEIEELYEFNSINRNSQLNLHDGSEMGSPQGNNFLLNQFATINKTRKPSNMSSNDSRSPALSPQQDKMRSSFNIQEEDNRLSLIQTINKFDSEHPHGARDLIDEMIKIYNNFSYIQEGLNTNHSRLLEDKARKQQEVQNQDKKLEKIKRLNAYLDEMEKNKQYEAQMLAVPEAFDSGLLMIPKTFENLNGISSQTNTHPNQVMSTVNILKSDNFQQDNDKTKELVQKNQNFVFNFFSNYCESAIRLCQILELVYGFSLNVCPIQIEQLSKSTIQFIKDIWAGKFDEMQESFSKMGKKIRHTTIQKIGTQELLNGEEQQTVYFKKIQSEKFSHEEIKQLYLEIFTKKDGLAEKFYELIKSERIIWFFCNIEQIRNFLYEQKRKNGLERGAVRSLDKIEELKSQGIAVFENKLQNVMELMVKILQKVKEGGKNCIRIIHNTYPDFNPKRRYNTKVARENDEIREAKLKATIKNDNYFRNNDPLMEDFIIIKKEDNYNMLMMDPSEQDKLKLPQQKKQEDKNQDQINVLIDYIKKTKNNGQQILIEQKKQQVQQMQKIKQIQQESVQSSQQQQQGNNLILNTVSSQEGGANYHRNSNQSVNLPEYIQNSQQQQQISSSNVNQISQESQMKFYLGSSQIKEDITRFKQLNKAEGQAIEEERERIHNLSKQKQLQELKELEKLLQQKNNKFFVSDEISKINERLHAEKKAPYKEKLIRNFSESQLVLSKVDRMDRFSGFIGPQVNDQIQDEKNQMVRTLRGELYQPDLNYLKSNSAYDIRKKIAQEQLNYLHDVKLQQTVQLNQSHSQSIQSTSKKNQYSFNLDVHSKQSKQRQPSPDEIAEDSYMKDSNQLNQQLSHFHPMNNSIKITANQLKRSQENENKIHQKEALTLKLKEIKSALKLPSANSTRVQNSETRPQTQGSNQRWGKKQENVLREGSSNKKEKMTLSGQNFFSSKVLRNTPSIHETTINKRINTPLSYNQFGISEIFSSENSIMFNNNNNIPNANNGPYNSQNLKFYQRYASPEGDAFFDSILNGPILNPTSVGNRPKTQQNNSRQFKDKFNDFNRNPLNNHNQEQQKPQSSHEGKRNLFYKQNQQAFQHAISARNQDDKDQVIEKEYYQQTYTSPDQNETNENQQQGQHLEAEESGQYNSNRQTDLYSTVSYGSSRTNHTQAHTNRPLHNQHHQYHAKKSQELENQQ